MNRSTCPAQIERQIAADRQKSAFAVERLKEARATWPAAQLVTARKAYRCDNRCPGQIGPGDLYIDPGECNPDRANGFGGYRYCLKCAGGEAK